MTELSKVKQNIHKLKKNMQLKNIKRLQAQPCCMKCFC